MEITGTQHLDSDAVRMLRSRRKLPRRADTGESSSGLSSVCKPTDSGQSLLTNQ